MTIEKFENLSLKQKLYGILGILNYDLTSFDNNPNYVILFVL